MAADFEFDTASKKGTLFLRKGGQVVTSKTINGNTVNYDSGGEIVSIVLPNPHATVNLAGIAFKHDEHVEAIRALDFHAFKSGG